ncbi:uncharacterized protein BDZ99DRAFT_488659 [Mytilinidion resinicola]|uniref:Membrane protein n=1 Tax=Mytilinidion resinicola TaxID=574789 RepID=A0A6A6YLH9_9PEZI|nr:uncharacterized protein BDZ99DRAFT_488659 [Mytilinidion resinicola]KAF2808727.1 membrane protein [Mytilinidion resinicola]
MPTIFTRPNSSRDQPQKRKSIFPQLNFSRDQPQTRKSKTRKTQLQFKDYFVGPRDPAKHSKWPRAMQMHGSVMPKLFLPICFYSIWVTVVTAVSVCVQDLAVHPIVLTVLGIVVGLALNFRSSTAYERYESGRKAWAALTSTSQSLARVIWMHTEVRGGEDGDDEIGKTDLLGKVSCLNLITAFAFALKHKLRYEPYTHYEDLQELVGHLDTFAKAADSAATRQDTRRHRLDQYLRLPMLRANPQAALGKTSRPLGSLPLEILSYISRYSLVTCERVLDTPMPIAYSIAISQITWIYVLTLPFQLQHIMEWTAIPVSIVTSYIILGIAQIGNEIDNPFGIEVNDLPLERFCTRIASDITITTANPRPEGLEFFERPDNPVFFPMSFDGYDTWLEKHPAETCAVLLARAGMTKTAMQRRQSAHNKVEESDTATMDTGTTCRGSDTGTIHESNAAMGKEEV